MGIFPVADSYCHTDPTSALGLSMSLIHAVELRRALAEHPSEPMDMTAAYFTATFPEAAERFALARDANNDRTRMWQGEKLDTMKRSGSYPLFVISAGGAVAMRDPEVFRKFTRRIGFLDRTSEFDTEHPIARTHRAHLCRDNGSGSQPTCRPHSR